MSWECPAQQRVASFRWTPKGRWKELLRYCVFVLSTFLFSNNNEKLKVMFDMDRQHIYLMGCLFFFFYSSGSFHADQLQFSSLYWWSARLWKNQADGRCEKALHWNYSEGISTHTLTCMPSCWKELSRTKSMFGSVVICVTKNDLMSLSVYLFTFTSADTERSHNPNKHWHSWRSQCGKFSTPVRAKSLCQRWHLQTKVGYLWVWLSPRVWWQTLPERSVANIFTPLDCVLCTVQ